MLPLILLASSALASPALAQSHEHHAAPPVSSQAPAHPHHAPLPDEDDPLYAVTEVLTGRHGALGALGDYPLGRDASGTAWQPDAVGAHGGHHQSIGGWMVMSHATLNFVHSRQG
ncbi:MAG TPA: hypothetical protein VGB49_06070, partial [Caulobacteraceae bacterium]